MYVGEANFLQQLYFGAKINESDIDFLTKYYGDEICPKVKDFNIDLAHDIVPSECGFYARGDYKELILIARRVDGSSYEPFPFCLLRNKRWSCGSVYNAVCTYRRRDAFYINNFSKKYE